MSGGSANNWWLRSPNTGNATNFRYINNNGNVNNNNASNSNGVCFGFCKQYRLDKVTQKGEINASAKGVYDLSERINKLSDRSDWTLLALRDKRRNSFNNHH